MPSTVVRYYRYHPSERRLEIIFTTGRRYSYHGVPHEVFADMEKAFSKGAFFNTHIRDQFRFSHEPKEATNTSVGNAP